MKYPSPLLIITSICFVSIAVAVIRKKNYNNVPIIDNTRGDVAIADLFKDKYATLFNSVSSSSNSMKAPHERI